MEYELTVEGRREPVIAVSHNPVEEGFYHEGDAVSVTFETVSAHLIPRSGG
jgi:iron(III) transport system ATP-binding protein